MLRLDHQPRVFRLIDDAIQRFALDLSGVRVLTEAASGAFVVTALIAARAGAEAVYAVTRDSRHGAAHDVLEYGREWAEAFNVADRIALSAGRAVEHAADADIVTNLGFVRPIGRDVITRLPRHAVVSLMWEPWEFRPEDVDLEACADAGIAVVATNERHPELRTFDYVGMLGLKLLMEAGVEAFRSRVVVIGSDPFGDAVAATLAAVGARVERPTLPDVSVPLDALLGGLVEQSDALMLVEHRDRRELIGGPLGIAVSRFAGGCRLVHIAGRVCDGELQRAGVVKHPARAAAPGYMTVTTDYVGVRPVIDLHTAGLRAGEIAVRCRRRGASIDDALGAAEASGLGLRVTSSSSMTS